MAKKLLIVMANTDTRNGEELGAPIFQATVAAAMDYEVEVVCTATSGRLMKKGVAEKLFVKEGSPKSVCDFMKDAQIRQAREPALLIQLLVRGDPSRGDDMRSLPAFAEECREPVVRTRERAILRLDRGQAQ